MRSPSSRTGARPVAEIVSDRIPGLPAITADRAGAGELLVFLHGVGGNRRNWTRQIAEFSRHFTAVAWDARGYGDSEDYEGPLTFDLFASDLLRLLDYYKASRAHLVGLSMGGNIATRFALGHPERVASLVLVDTDRGMVHFSEAERQDFVRRRRDPLLAGRTFAEMAPDVVQTLLSPQATEAARRDLLDSMLRLRKESYIKAVEATIDFDVTRTIRQITCPTLIVVGEHDRLTPIEEAEAIRAEIRGAKLAIIPNAGHVSNLEQPDIFNSVVLDFLLQHSA